MFDVQEMIDNFQDFLLENKKKTIAVCGILIFMTFCAVIALCISETKSSKKGTGSQEEKLVLDQALLVPPAPQVPEGYITTRKTEKNWSEEEIEKWFTQPDEAEVEQLGLANDRIIQEIIGAAP